MQQMAFWKYRLFIGAVALSLLAFPGCSQQPEPASQSTSAPPSAPGSAPGPGADATAYVEYGIASSTKGDLDAAIGAFTEAIEIDPGNAPAYYNRGLAYSLQNQQDEAFSDYSQAILINPRYEEAYFQRGSLNGQKGNFDDAISDLTEVIKLDPGDALAQYNLGHVYYFKGNLDGALEEIDLALRLDPAFSYSYFVRGLIQRAQGYRTEATSDFQKSLSLGFPDAAFWVWITEMENGQHDLAHKDLSDALNKPGLFKPDDWPSQIGTFLLGTSDQDQLMAKARTGNETETHLRLCQAWFYSGMNKQFSGDTQGAQACFAQAMATESKGSEEFVEANRATAQLQKP